MNAKVRATLRTTDIIAWSHGQVNCQAKKIESDCRLCFVYSVPLFVFPTSRHCALPLPSWYSSIQSCKCCLFLDPFPTDPTAYFFCFPLTFILIFTFCCRSYSTNILSHGLLPLCLLTPRSHSCLLAYPPPLVHKYFSGNLNANRSQVLTY